MFIRTNVHLIRACACKDLQTLQNPCQTLRNNADATDLTRWRVRSAATAPAAVELGNSWLRGADNPHFKFWRLRAGRDILVASHLQLALVAFIIRHGHALLQMVLLCRKSSAHEQ